MKVITECQKDIPVLYEADVVVVGGGPGGIGASLAAARNGARTILIERFNCLGGLQTQSLNPRFSRVDPDLFGGIFQDILGRLRSGGAILESIPSQPEELAPVITFSPEAYQYLLDNMMAEAEVKLFYYAFAAGAIKEGNILKGVFIESMEGRQAILGKVVIDATGNGNIAWKSGTPCLDDAVSSGTKKGRHRPFGWAYSIRDVNIDEFESFRREHMDEWGEITCGGSLIKEAKEDGKLSEKHGPYFLMVRPYLYAGTILMWSPTYNLPMGHCPWMLEDISSSTIDLRKNAWVEFNLLKHNVPGFENAHMDHTAINHIALGGHTISGEYVLTVEDIRQQEPRLFDDSVCVCNMMPDVFGPDDEHELILDVPPYDIPYRCFIPRETENLLAAGSTISADYKVLTGSKYCAPSVCQGQAAGTAAALSVKKNVTPRQLDVRLLQDTLSKQDAIISLKYVKKTTIDNYLDRIEKLRKNPPSWSDGTGASL